MTEPRDPVELDELLTDAGTKPLIPIGPRVDAVPYDEEIREYDDA